MRVLIFVAAILLTALDAQASPQHERPHAPPSARRDVPVGPQTRSLPFDAPPQNWRDGRGSLPMGIRSAYPQARFMTPSPSGRLWNRGQFLPPDYRGSAVADPRRYHLRTPPSGYGWVGDGRNAYLMQRSTGMVLDSVPSAYDPPHRDRPPR